MLKGSARSVNGANIYEALKSAKDILISFGGIVCGGGRDLGGKKSAAVDKGAKSIF